MRQAIRTSFSRHKNDRESGFLIAEVLVALGILALLTPIVYNYIVNLTESATLLEQRSDLEQLRFVIANDISCEETIKEGTPCNSNTQNIADTIELLKKTPSGVKSVLGKRYKGGYRYGRYLVRAGCSQSEQSLIVQAIPFLDSGNKSRGPRKITWGDKESHLFGGADGAIPLCFNANNLGSVAMAKDDAYGEVTVIAGPPIDEAISQRSIRFAGGDSLRGLECREDMGYRLTGCYNEVLDGDNGGEAVKPIQQGNICVAPSAAPAKNGKAPIFVERTLTIICLKAE